MKDYLNQEKLNLMKNGKGFIAALDQSGGSSARTLLKYGVDSSMYQNDEEMFELIHDMRKRVFTSPVFTNEKIIGSILFYKTMESKVEDKYTSEYLWKNKKILSFLKVDKGLMEEEKQVKLMKDIPDLEEQLSIARTRDVFGTKMRSVILGANREGIRKIVKQQFDFAKIICENGLVPIIEPEVDIHIEDKVEAEKILKEEANNEESETEQEQVHSDIDRTSEHIMSPQVEDEKTSDINHTSEHMMSPQGEDEKTFDLNRTGERMMSPQGEDEKTFDLNRTGERLRSPQVEDEEEEPKIRVAENIYEQHKEEEELKKELKKLYKEELGLKPYRKQRFELLRRFKNMTKDLLYIYL